jgi:hypothetical protein
VFSPKGEEPRAYEKGVKQIRFYFMARGSEGAPRWGAMTGGRKIPIKATPINTNGLHFLRERG